MCHIGSLPTGLPVFSRANLCVKRRVILLFRTWCISWRSNRLPRWNRLSAFRRWQIIICESLLRSGERSGRNTGMLPVDCLPILTITVVSRSMSTRWLYWRVSWRARRPQRWWRERWTIRRWYRRQSTSVTMCIRHWRPPVWVTACSTICRFGETRWP